MADSLSHSDGNGPDDTAAPPADAGVDLPGGTGDADALTIRGRVRDALGVALPRALVTLTSAGGGRRLAKTRSAADGAFSVTAPAQGEYLLAASSPQLGTESIEVRLSGRPVEVEFRMRIPGTTAPRS